MPTIVLMNQKGGVGKTTTAINLAVQAALQKPTLAIDMDEQGNLSKQFGIHEPSSTVREALKGFPFNVVPIRKNLDVLPSNSELVGIDLELASIIGREHQLKKALKNIEKNYHYMFIDCPSNTSVVTTNALAVADYVILPINLDMLSIEGIDHMVDFITMVKNATNPKLSILGILITKFEENTKVSEKILSEINDRGWDNILFKTRIRKNVTISESQAFRQTIFDYSKNSNGAKDYVALGNEVLRKIKNLEKV